MDGSIDKKAFLDAVESLKRYRRPELSLSTQSKDDPLTALYTDLLPNDYILTKCLQNNTTYLIGRKGTGKSTIFLRLEQEYRKKPDYVSCYLDVKTIYDSSQSNFVDTKQINELLPKELLEKYLIERSFIQNVLSKIPEKISEKTDHILSNLINKFVTTKSERVKQRLTNLKERINNNKNLQEIEIPILKTVTTIEQNHHENRNKGSGVLKAGVRVAPESLIPFQPEIKAESCEEEEIKKIV